MLGCVILQVLCDYNFYGSSGLEEGGRVDYGKRDIPDNIIISRRVLA